MDTAIIFYTRYRDIVCDVSFALRWFSESIVHSDVRRLFDALTIFVCFRTTVPRPTSAAQTIVKEYYPPADLEVLDKLE